MNKAQRAQEFVDEERKLGQTITLGEEQFEGYKKDFKKLQDTLYSFSTQREVASDPAIKALLQENEAIFQENRRKADQLLENKREELVLMKKQHEQDLEGKSS